MTTPESDRNKKGSSAAILFIIWPFLSLISAFKNYREPWAKNIFWAFTAFYGFVFAIGAESQGADIVQYIEGYQALYGVDMSLSEAISYFQNSGEIDILRTFIAIVLSRFTDTQSILTLIYGIIFGYFISRNIWYILERLEGNLKSITILLLICFFLVNPIWNMNGFRFWTAAHIFIFGLLPFLLENKKKRLFICAASILVHFSFIVAVGILFAYLFMGNRLFLYFCFFLATFFISEINLDFFNRIVENYAPDIIQERTEGYRNEQYVENFREGAPDTQNWYVVWYGRAIRWSVMGFLVMLFLKGRAYISENPGWLRLFSFTLLIYGVANILSSLPSAGRFVTVANLSALAMVMLYIQNREYSVTMKRFVTVATPAILLYIIVAVRVGLYSMSATAFLGNPVIALFMEGEHLSLNEVLRWII